MRKKRYTLYPVEGRPGRRWKRIVLWSSAALVVALLLVGAGSYVWFRAQVSSANERVGPEVISVLQEKPSTTLTVRPADGGPTTTVKPPSPSAMNLLIIGSDRRADDPSLGGRSDTLMVVHVDPAQDYLSVLSLPRDLRVQIPGYGRNKLNTAFALGGPALTIKTIEQYTGVDINHYMEIGFDAFADIVDSLGGVYVDVDRRYYNPQYYYEPIDIYPGYQLLKGGDALDYVRFRHDRNADFGRMARQQRFLTAVREQAMGWNLPFKLPGLISALFRNIATDLDANEILRLTRWGVGLNGDSVSSIALEGSTPTINGASYVVVSEGELAEAVSRLLHKPDPNDPDKAVQASATTTTTADTTGTTAEPAEQTLAGLSVEVRGASGRPGEAAAAAQWLRSLGATVVSSRDDGGGSEKRSAVSYPTGMREEAEQVGGATGIGRVAGSSRVELVTLVLGEDFELPEAFAVPPSPDTIPDAWVWKRFAPLTPFAVRAPAYLPDGYRYVRRFPDDYGTYDIQVGGGGRPAFRMLYASEDNADQVLGITQTTWLDAPAASKGLQVAHEGVVFTVVRSGTDVERVWWKRDGVLYFVSNTLSLWLDEDEMLKIARSMIAIPGQ